MTRDLFRSDAYLRDCRATVVAIGDQGIVLDQTVFYPLGGGQAGDSGRLVAAALPVSVNSISDAELDANPALVKSMSVQPPRGTGRIRTIRIGDAIDYQPCGGTHVANTSEIGAVVVTRIEKKSATTRRVVLGFAPAGT